MSNNVEQFFAIEENVKAYADWATDPLTKRLLDMASDAARPIGMSNPTGEVALYLQGVAVGMHSIIDFLKHAEVFAKVASTGNMDPVASFGAAEILNNWGVLPKKDQEK
jgi:hypothetical protein